MLLVDRHHHEGDGRAIRRELRSADKLERPEIARGDQPLGRSRLAPRRAADDSIICAVARRGADAGATMQIDYLVLADAVAAVGGKHYIHGGGWDTLFARAFPFVHPTMGVALRLRVPWGASGGQVNFTLDVLDADGRTILPDPPGAIRGSLDIGRPPHLTPGDDQVLPLALAINNLRFGAPGLYVVICHLDGGATARAPFRVAETPTNP